MNDLQNKPFVLFCFVSYEQEIIMLFGEYKNKREISLGAQLEIVRVFVFLT